MKEVAVLTEFYRDRLKDAWQVHHVVIEGMLGLARKSSISPAKISIIILYIYRFYSINLSNKFIL